MAETLYTAAPELADPRGFAARAGRDLKASWFVGWQLFRANLRARHRRTLFGYLWLLVPAAVATAVCVYLQSRRIIAVGATELPYALHVLVGVLMWQVFVEALNAPLQQLAASRHLLARTQLAHEAVLLGGLLDVAFNAALRFLVLLAAVAAFGIAPAATLLLVPLGFAAVALLGFVVGLFAAPVGMLYDDVRQGIALLTVIWFFLTPVLYPAPGDGPLRLNPVTPLLEGTRGWIVGAGASSGFLLVTALALAGLVLGWLLYRLARPHLVARL